MIEINLLADQDKEERKLEKKLGVVLRTGLSIVFSLIILLGLMFSIENVLRIEFEAAQADALAHPMESSKDIADAENLIKNANAVSAKVAAAAKQTPFWSKVFKKLSDDAPDGLMLETIHVEKEHMKITGFAKTRDDFLSFQDKLNSEGFSKMVSPVSNLVSPENFDFTIEFDVDKNYLSQP